ncbi:hypothetical protein PDO_4935 [Rhizobium sp. PDO1-076]|nr:hypothetical protein PDO_4935 [Rhizobium sp. PDO1-076]
MFADTEFSILASGLLRENLFPRATSLQKILEFIGSQLPVWRDREDRPFAQAEDELTDQLCAHLLSASRLHGFDFLQFRRETRDKVKASRKHDLIISPNSAVIEVEGRRHTEFDILFPLECKRLPTPVGRDRDEREYVFSSKKSTGGVQRFKAGHHAPDHKVAGMIAYVQVSDIASWSSRVTEWIDGLLQERTVGWTKADHLVETLQDKRLKIGRFTSTHGRQNKLEPITLHHFWIELGGARS